MVAPAGEPGDLARQRAVGVALAGIERREVLLDGREVAPGDRTGERAGRADAERVGHRRAHERGERLERNAARIREPLDLAEQRDEMIRRHDRGRVVLRAVAVGELERAQAERGRELGRLRIAGHRGPRAAQALDADRRRGNVCNGCSAPTRTSGRTSSIASNTSRPNEPARWITSAPGSSDGATARAAASIARSGVATITSAAPRPASETSDASASRHAAAALVDAASGDRPATATTDQSSSSKRERDRGAGPSGPDERDRAVSSRRVGCFHAALFYATDGSVNATPASRTPCHVASASDEIGRDVAQAARARTRAPTCAGAEW